MTLTSSSLEIEATPGADSDLLSESAPTSGRRLAHAFVTDWAAMLSSAYIVLIIVMALFAPLLAQITGWGPYDFDQSAIDPNMGAIPIGPGGGISSEHWFGVEPGNGRDIFIRIAYGARVSMTVALSATLITTVIGTVMGMLAGYFGGAVDSVISRVMEFMMAFPALIFMIAILSALPADNRVVLLVVVISIFGWPYLARIVRAQTMSIKEREFVESAKASGARSGQIIFREILPNLTSTILVMAALAVPGYVGTEAGLSFLGVGVVPPTPSWGQMIASAAPWYAVDPMYFIIPGTFLFLLVLSFVTLGDRIRTILASGEIRA